MAINLQSELRDTESLVIETPTGGVTKGQVVQHGDLYAFAFRAASVDEDDWEDFAEEYAGIIAAPMVSYDKASGSGSPTFSQGDKIYYDTSSGQATTSSTGNIEVGYALEDASANDSAVFGSFDGRV